MRRLTTILLATAATAATAATTATSDVAAAHGRVVAPGSAVAARATADTVTLALGGPAAQRLRERKARFVGGGGAKATRARLTLPVRGFTVRGATATLELRGTLTLRAGRRTLRLTAPRVEIGTSSRLTVKAGARRMTLATLFAPTKIRTVTSAGAELDGAPATLTATAARRIQTALRLPRRPSGRIGTLTASAGGPTAAPAPAPAPVTVPSEAPALVPTPAPGGDAPVEPTPEPTATPEPEPPPPVCATARNGYAAGEHLEPLPAAPVGAVPVTATAVTWGFSASLRLAFMAYDPDRENSYQPRTVDGVECAEPWRTFAGDAAQAADDRFAFTGSTGWHDPATGAAALNVAGAFRIGYFIGGWARYPAAIPMCQAAYCGLWATFADPQIRLDPGAQSGTLSAYADAGGNNSPWRYVPWERRTFGALDLRDITPDTSVPGEVTWRAVPVTLTEEGGPLGLEYYSVGDALDPITITLRTAG